MMRKLHEDRFTAKDTALPYRQINYLDEHGLLTGEREADAQWRRFCLKDLIYLRIVKEIRQYGVSDEVLRELHAAFYQGRNVRASDIAIFIAMDKPQLFLNIFSDGQIGFYNITMKHLLQKGQKSRLEINLNEIIGELWEEHENERLHYIDEQTYIAEIIRNHGLSQEEAKIMNLVRRTEYLSLELERGKNGKITKITSEQAAELSDKDLIKSIAFGEVTQIRNNGKTVYTRVRRTHKI